MAASSAPPRPLLSILGLPPFLLLLLFLPSASPTLTLHTLTPPPSLVNAHAVKAWETLGPDIYSTAIHDTAMHNAPLTLLQLNEEMCDELFTWPKKRGEYEVEMRIDRGSAATSKNISLHERTSRLHPTAYQNATVVLIMDDLITICSFSPFYSNAASVYLNLVASGASAILVVADYNAPGIISNIITPNKAQQREASAAIVPFVGIGRIEGTALAKKLGTEDPVHVTFFFDDNR